MATRVVVQKRLSFGMMAAFFLLTVVGGGGAAWFVSQQRDAAAGRAVASAQFGVAGQVVHLEGFTVNLADTEESHFLRVTMDLELERLPAPTEKEKPGSGLPMSRIRDTILSVLAACKADPLLTTEGKLQLKKNLREALNRGVPEISVRDIYFTEFLVQR